MWPHILASTALDGIGVYKYAEAREPAGSDLLALIVLGVFPLNVARGDCSEALGDLTDKGRVLHVTA